MRKKGMSFNVSLGKRKTKMAKEIIQQAEGNRPDETHEDARMKVSVVSFSYPRGVPDDPDDDYWGGFVFDCRSLPDPHGIAALKGMSGLDKPVIDFFERHKDRVDRFLDAAEALVAVADTTGPCTWPNVSPSASREHPVSRLR